MYKYPKGSEWRKWDLHIHTPASILHNEFPSDWDEYVKALFKNAIALQITAIGVTDYYSLEGYRKIRKEYLENNTKLKSLFSQDEIESIKRILVIPNIEFRLNKLVVGKENDLKWNRKINLHVLFSDELSVEDIEENFLNRLTFEHEGRENSQKSPLTPRNLERYGEDLKKHQPEFNDKSDLYVGMLNASIDDSQIVDTLNENKELFGRKYLIGLYSDEDLSRVSWTSQGHGMRKVLIQKSNLFFSSNENTRKFSLGEFHDSKKDFLDEFHSFIPCIWSSDSHKIDNLFQPDEDRITWIKSDPTFEGLRQILYEPKYRVRVQKDKPDEKTPYLVIDKVRFLNPSNTKLFSQNWIELNPNLNTIIGGKSSGKSILLHHIARTISPETVDKQSELSKVNDYVDFRKENPFDMEVVWQNGDIEKLTDDLETKSQISFIPQLYINYLAEEKGEEHLTELIEGILEQNEKYKAFVEDQRKKIQSCNKEIGIEISRLISLRKQASKLIEKKKKVGDISNINNEITRLNKEIIQLKAESGFSDSESSSFDILSGKKEILQVRHNNLSDFESAITRIDQKVDLQLEITKGEVKIIFEDENHGIKGIKILEELKTLIFTDLDDLKSKNRTDYQNILVKVRNIIDVIKANSTETELLLAPFLKKVKGQQKLKQTQAQLDIQKKKVIEFNKLEKELTSIVEKGKKASLDIQSYYANLFQTYQQVRDELDDEKYKKIGEELELTVSLEFDNNQFSSFTELFDGRAKFNQDFYAAFDDFNKFQFKEETHLNNIRLIFDKIRVPNKLTLRLKTASTNEQLLSALLADYFKFNYRIRHKTDDILKMSPGKRGLVLLQLILYLSNAKHPILIDQPEDNLDNRTIYNELREFIIEKKLQRQIIIVTHNANLVVATDSECIIVANQDGQQIGKDNKAFQFEYISGSIENTYISRSSQGILNKMGIREHVCEILEGGQEAFEKREEKYGFKR